jgi:hypothetical protein
MADIGQQRGELGLVPMELGPSRMFVNGSHFGRGFCGEYDLQSTQGQESPRFVRGLRGLIHRKAGHEEGQAFYADNQ